MTPPATNARPSIALVGCGRWGRNILRDLNALGCAVHVVDRAARAREQAAGSGAASVHGNLSGLRAVDGVIVATPTASHERVARDALALGVPVYVEKPLTNDPVSAARLAQEGGERLFVMHKWRYHPGVEAIARIAGRGELGRVAGLRTVRAQCGYDHGDVDPIWTLAPHDLSIAIAVLGGIPALREARVHSVAGRPCGVSALFGDAPWLSCEVTACAHRRRREIALLCERGIAVLPEPESDHVDLIAFEAEGQRLMPRVERVPVSTELPLMRELQAFVGHLHGGPAPLASAAEGVAVVDAIAALRARCGIEDAR